MTMLQMTCYDLRGSIVNMWNSKYIGFISFFLPFHCYVNQLMEDFYEKVIS